MKNILVATDFSPLAQAAMETASKIANKTKSTLTILHVIEAPYDHSFNVEGEIKKESMENDIYVIESVRSAKLHLDELLEDECLNGLHVKTALRIGNVLHGIENYIDDHDIDLTVVGTAGVNAVSRILIGSTAEKLVRQATCPVLTVHNPTTNFDIQSIVLATTTNEEETEVIQLLEKLQRIYNNTVHLVTINTPNNFTRDVDTLNKLEAFAKKHQLSKYTVNTFNDMNEEDGILNFAQRVNADLIAISTHGRKGIAHLLTGSIAEDVVNQADKPVLTVAQH